jgi:hypothetical protein
MLKPKLRAVLSQLLSLWLSGKRVIKATYPGKKNSTGKPRTMRRTGVGKKAMLLSSRAKNRLIAKR